MFSDKRLQSYMLSESLTFTHKPHALPNYWSVQAYRNVCGAIREGEDVKTRVTVYHRDREARGLGLYAQ